MVLNGSLMNINYTLYIDFLFIAVSFDTYNVYSIIIDLSDVCAFYWTLEIVLRASLSYKQFV